MVNYKQFVLNKAYLYSENTGEIDLFAVTISNRYNISYDSALEVIYSILERFNVDDYINEEMEILKFERSQLVKRLKLIIDVIEELQEDSTKDNSNKIDVHLGELYELLADLEYDNE